MRPDGLVIVSGGTNDVSATNAFTARRAARLFGLTLLDLDAGFARETRRDHTEYDRRRRARRRRRRS